MKLAITTAPRAGTEYLSQSLLSLTTVGGYDGEIHLFLSTADDGPYRHLEQSPRFVIHRLTPEQWAEISLWPLDRRHSFSYWRVLNHFAGQGEDLCLCEDDLLYTPRFASKLQTSVRLMREIADDYILALYCCIDYASVPEFRRGPIITSYPAQEFFGLQAMYYPHSVLADYAAYIHEHGVVHWEKSTDRQVADYSATRQNVYLVAHSLAQHIGFQSTGLGRFHDSPTFGRPWPIPEEG